MKRFDDWKKYVKDEIDKADSKKRLNDTTSPKRHIPTIDNDRFAIHRNIIDESNENTDSQYDEKEHVVTEFEIPEEERPMINGRTNDSKSDSSSMHGISSPFVSVQEVWQAAEKSSKQRKFSNEDEKHFSQQSSMFSNIERKGSIPIKRQPLPQITRTSASKTREEILERLVNPTVTLDEAAKIMGVCKATVRRYTAKGVLPHYRTPGNQRRFKLNDIIEFIENQRK